MVNRLAKGALPPNFNVQSVAQSAISKSATVFVNYLTAQYVQYILDLPYPQQHKPQGPFR